MTKNVEMRKCKFCGKEFTVYHHSQKFCYAECRERYGNRKYSEEWAQKVKSDFKPNSNSIEYSFFRKKYGPSKRYRVCRG